MCGSEWEREKREQPGKKSVPLECMPLLEDLSETLKRKLLDSTRIVGSLTQYQRSSLPSTTFSIAAGPLIAQTLLPIAALPISSLSRTQREELDEPFTLKGLQAATTVSPSWKTPGVHGFPATFYERLSSLLAPPIYYSSMRKLATLGPYSPVAGMPPLQLPLN
ncbi:hypothetical protein NDU88_003894 [Pleurodeles waltl]|uniref:Uncharacterized protein n=1 Tax=Pleurodeles waltl TaxID=8319 RepID=A0AAV7KYQ3_PLEWA|nr:hypothetical protein NDU88_003894 [Pleurodeles waltl]